MINLVTLIRFKGSGWPVTDELLSMQWEAIQSWARIGANITIIAKPGKVFWKELCEELMKYPVAAQIGSDDILTEPIKEVFDFIASKSEPSWAVGHRRTFNVGEPIESGVIEPPYGLDCFVANKQFWKELSATDAMELCKLGTGEDNGICSFGNLHHGKNGYDFTDKKCLYHPRHEGRIPERNTFNVGAKAETGYSGIPEQKVP